MVQHLKYSPKIGPMGSMEMLEGTYFTEAAEIDFGSADAVDLKITDAATAKGELISVQAVETETFDGDGDSTIKISTASGGAAPMCGTFDCKTNGNYVGAVFGAMPNSDNSEIVADGGDIYAYSAAVSNRSQGKLYIVLTFMKTA